MSTVTYTVIGMACGHCEDFVSEEISEVDGVESVTVDVAGEAVTVTSRVGVPETRIRRAVEEAGYEFAGRRDGARA